MVGDVLEGHGVVGGDPVFDDEALLLVEARERRGDLSAEKVVFLEFCQELLLVLPLICQVFQEGYAVGIGDFGIVRTRYEGCTRVDGLTVFLSGGVVATLVGSTTGLWAIAPDGRTTWLRREPRLRQTRPTFPLGLPNGGFSVATKGPRLGVFDAGGRNRGWTGVPEKAAQNGTSYAGVTAVDGAHIAVVRVLE